MKIRTGFVSNSSSSSFCIYGTYIQNKNYDDIEQIMNDTKGFSWSCGGEYSEGIYVGRTFTSIGDNETGSEFKKTTEETLKKKFGDNIECSTIEQSWYNG